jgi:SAM-dependent methyltransferase
MNSPSSNIFGNAKAYEAYVGRWSPFVARELLTWLHLPPGLAWLDVGAGTGLLTQAILEAVSPAKVVAVDLSPDYIDFARQRIHDDRVEFRVEDASSIAFESAPFDAAVAGLVLNFVPDAGQVVAGMRRAVRDGGTVAAYVWDYNDRMDMMRHFWDAAIQVDEAAARGAHAAQQYALCNPDSLRSLFQAAGLEAVETRAIDIETRFADFDDYWTPFLSAQGSVAKYLRGISDDTRDAIRDQLQRQLPTADDGTIPLVARAWAVKGKK